LSWYVSVSSLYKELAFFLPDRRRECKPHAVIGLERLEGDTVSALIASWKRHGVSDEVIETQHLIFWLVGFRDLNPTYDL